MSPLIEANRIDGMDKPLLKVVGLRVYFHTVDGIVKAVRDMSFDVSAGRVLGIVGESGSGKTVTGLSIMGLLPKPGKVEAGSIFFADSNLLNASDPDMRSIRGGEIAMVFQNASNALNPVITIGEQIREVLQLHTQMTTRESIESTVKVMTQMGISESRSLLDRHPWEISTGMAQRAMLAMGLALSPKLLIADEPTSSLDVIVQAQILQRLNEYRRKSNSSIILFTHDLGVIAQMADEVIIMYGGYKLEHSDTRNLYASPKHPYTYGLLQAIPRFDRPVKRLSSIKGSLPSVTDAPDRCPFLDRCDRALGVCRTDPMPDLEEAEKGHYVACYNPIP